VNKQYVVCNCTITGSLKKQLCSQIRVLNSYQVQLARKCIYTSIQYVVLKSILGDFIRALFLNSNDLKIGQYLVRNRLIFLWEENKKIKCQTLGASHIQADAQRSKKSTFQAIHIQFSVMDIVTKSFEMSKTGLGIS
jgi:hypothetical protein